MIDAKRRETVAKLLAFYHLRPPIERFQFLGFKFQVSGFSFQDERFNPTVRI